MKLISVGDESDPNGRLVLPFLLGQVGQYRRDVRCKRLGGKDGVRFSLERF